METEIRFLHDLEGDLVRVAALQRYASGEGPGVAPRRRGPRRWKPWVGAAAALLTLAWGIGFLAQGGLHTATSYQSGAAAPATAPFASASAGQAVDGGTRSTGNSSEVPGLGPVAGASPVMNGYADGANQQHLGGESASSGSPGSGSAATTAGGTVDLAKIERDGSLALTIANGSFGRRYREVVAIAVANRGMLQSSETQDTGTGTLVLKIPASNFDRALVQLQKLGHVDASSVTGRDVTADFIDQQAHLRILQNERNVLSGLAQNANSVSQLVSLTAKVSSIQEEIDSTVGQLRYLNNQVAQSTIKVTLSERDAVQAEQVTTDDEIENPSLGRAWDRGIQGFFGVLASVVVGLGYLLPLAVIAAVVIAPIMLVRRRRRAAS
jgi:hypothetical protein